MELLQSYSFDRRYFHSAPPCKQVLLSQQIQIYTCLDECSPMNFVLIIVWLEWELEVLVG